MLEQRRLPGAGRALNYSSCAPSTRPLRMLGISARYYSPTCRLDVRDYFVPTGEKGCPFSIVALRELAQFLGSRLIYCHGLGSSVSCDVS